MYRKDRALDKTSNRNSPESRTAFTGSGIEASWENCSRSQLQHAKVISTTSRLTTQTRRTSCAAYNILFGTVIIVWVTSLHNTTNSFRSHGDDFNSSETEVLVESKEIRFVPSIWLSSTSYTVRLDYLNGTTMRNLVSYNIIPHSSQIFGLVREGQLDDVKRLFLGKRASPFDVDPEGHNLIHVSYLDPNLSLKHLLSRRIVCCKYIAVRYH